MRLWGRGRDDAEDEAARAGDEAPKAGVATASRTLRDLLVVTYAVPVEKAKRHVPEGLPLDKLPGPDGDLVAFAQTLVAYNEGARWSPLPGSAGASYHQITYRLLTRRGGRRGAFDLRTFVSESDQHVAQRVLHRQADYARVSLYIDGDPARGTYRAYRVRASGDLGKTEIEIRALPAPPAAPTGPFGKIEDMVTFLTDRDDVYFRASAPKEGVGLLPTRTGPLAPAFGEVVSARLTPWTDVGLLSADDLLHPVSVLIQAALPVVTSPPRFARVASAPA